MQEIKNFRDKSVQFAITDFIVEKVMPVFFYTSHFERMSGEVSIKKLTEDITNENVSPGDQIFIDFMEYAGIQIDELKEAGTHEELKAKCEAASNKISDEILRFWSQNNALSVEIDLTEGMPNDNPPFNDGTIAKIRIHNANHRVSIPLSERSAGFVWFFSFLSQFKQLKKKTGNAILLLDEPGLTLHGKAQADLLRYIVDILLPEYQIIYSTHSPFMVPTDRLADIRVVEDVIEKIKGNKPTVRGTKVSSNILSVGKDSLLPLHGHLGYELTQSLFIGKNTLLVEGPSDILYIKALSQALENRSRKGLDRKWIVCPTGGIDKIQPFASLFGGNRLNIAVLCDLAYGEKKKVERLKASEILKAGQIYTIADFTGKSEGDIEDIFHPELYSQILNEAFSLSGNNIISASRLSESKPHSTRIVKQAENVFKRFPRNVPEFNHFIPANWLIGNIGMLEEDREEVNSTLDIAENIFKAFNALL